MKAGKIDVILAIFTLIALLFVLAVQGCSHDSVSAKDVACVETEDSSCPEYEDETVIKVF